MDSDEEEEEEESIKNSFIDLSAADETVGNLVIDSQDESELMETSTFGNDISVMETSTSENITNKSFKSIAESHNSIIDYEMDKENDQSVSNSFTEDINIRNSLSSTKTHFNEIQNSSIKNQSVLKSIIENDLVSDSEDTVFDLTKTSEKSSKSISKINSSAQRVSVDLFGNESDSEVEEISKKMETSSISIDDDVIEIGDSPVRVNMIYSVLFLF